MQSLKYPVHDRPDSDPTSTSQPPLRHPCPAAQLLNGIIKPPFPREVTVAEDPGVGRLERLPGLVRLEGGARHEREGEPDEEKCKEERAEDRVAPGSTRF